MSETTVAVEKPKKLAKVRLTGQDGNAFNLLALCIRAGEKAGYTKEQLKAFQKQAMSGNYDNLLSACCEWFDVR